MSNGTKPSVGAAVVRDRMSSGVVTVLVSDTLDVVVARMRALRISGFPVLDPFGKLVGVVSEVDVARALAPVKGVDSFPGFLEMFLKVRRDEQKDPFSLVLSRLRHLRVGGCMTASVITVDPSTSLVEAARLLSAHKVNRLPVIEKGKLVGIITRTDLVKTLAESSPRESREGATTSAVRSGVPA